MRAVYSVCKIIAEGCPSARIRKITEYSSHKTAFRVCGRRPFCQHDSMAEFRRNLGKLLAEARICRQVTEGFFGTTQHAHDTGNPKWDVNVLLVYNDAGYQHSLQHKISQLQEELCSLVNKLFTLKGPAKLTREWLQHFAPSRAACSPVCTPSQEHLYRSPSKVLEAPSDLDYPQIENATDSTL